MSTQGLVTVMSGADVLMKVVAGCNGMRVQALADRLKANWPLTAEQAYEEAYVRAEFGCPSCLAIVTNFGDHYRGDESLSGLYRGTFQQPAFNPRSDSGAPEYLAVIQVD